MKRWFWVLVLVLIAGAVSGFDLSVGICTDYQTLTQSLGINGYQESYRFPELGVGAFIDATFLRASVKYTFTWGNPSGSVFYDGFKDSVDSDWLTSMLAGAEMSYLDVAAVVKVPIRLGAHSSLSPAVGVEYLLNLSFTQHETDLKEGLSERDEGSFDDLYVVGGLIVAFDVSRRVIVTIDAQFGYNLTPDYAPDMIGPGVDFGGWQLKAGLSAGIKLISS